MSILSCSPPSLLLFNHSFPTFSKALRKGEQRALLKMKPWLLLLTLLLFYPAETGGKAPQHTQGFSQGLPVLPQAVLWDPSAGGAWSRHRALLLPPGMLLILPGTAPTPAEPSPRGETNPARAEKAIAQGSRERSIFPCPSQGCAATNSPAEPRLGGCSLCQQQPRLGILGESKRAWNGDCLFCHLRERGKPLKFPCLTLPEKRNCRLCV